jgi:hypothetical protein
MIDIKDINEEHIEEAYKLLEEYCNSTNQPILKFVKNKDNIKIASEHIHKQLNFALRLILKPTKIEMMIIENHTWIVTKAKEQHSKKSKFKKTTSSSSK